MATPRVITGTISANGNTDISATTIGAPIDGISFDNLALWIDPLSASAGAVDLRNRPPGQTTYHSLLSEPIDLTGVIGKKLSLADIGDLRLVTTSLADGPIGYRLKLS